MFALFVSRIKVSFLNVLQKGFPCLPIKNRYIINVTQKTRLGIPITEGVYIQYK